MPHHQAFEFLKLRDDDTLQIFSGNHSIDNNNEFEALAKNSPRKPTNP